MRLVDALPKAPTIPSALRTSPQFASLNLLTKSDYIFSDEQLTTDASDAAAVLGCWWAGV